MGRHIAKNIVAAGLAKKCEIQIAYAIGVAEPVSVMVDLMGTGVLPKEKVEDLVTEVFDLRPAAIIEHLDLLRPIYRKTSAYGHFGRSEPEFSWEKTDMAKILKEKAAL
jgi:S-adenosylmethionine synthetase